jgi:glycosyltransferase involved in cell wall biosynthesis
MKILHVIPSLSPKLGGPTIVALKLVHELRRQGVDAEIATTNYDVIGSLDVPLNKKIDYVFDATYNLSVPAWFFPYSSPSMRYYIFSLPLTLWLWENIPKYDVIDSHYLFSYASTCSAIISNFYGIPYTMRAMGQLSSWALNQGQLKKKLYLALLEQRNLRNASAIHCTSLAEAQDVSALGIHAPRVVLPLGVDQPAHTIDASILLRNQYGIPEKTPIILFISRLDKKKRVDLVIESLSKLRDREYTFYSIIAGSGDSNYYRKLMDLVDKHDLHNYISFPGFVDGPDKNILLQGSDLFVLPSHSENFGIAVAEALIAKLPVIITPGIQISSDILAANAGLVIEDNIDSLTSAIANLIDDSILRKNLGQNGYNFAKTHYDWHRISQNLSDVYGSICEQKTLN